MLWSKITVQKWTLLWRQISCQFIIQDHLLCIDMELIATTVQFNSNQQSSLISAYTSMSVYEASSFQYDQFWAESIASSSCLSNRLSPRGVELESVSPGVRVLVRSWSLSFEGDSYSWPCLFHVDFSVRLLQWCLCNLFCFATRTLFSTLAVFLGRI